MTRRVVMAVRSDSFAGVEQYICASGRELDRRGWQVLVIGGEPDRMRATLPPSISFVPATSTADVARALLLAGRQPLVHAHMTAAEVAAVVTRPVTRARLVATRHFAAARGSSPAVRAALRPIARRLAAEIAISEFVASRMEVPAVVIHNGVEPRQARPDDEARTVLVMQRLEPEKATDVALRAWQVSGLGDRGWRLLVAGRGAQEPTLRALAVKLGVDTSVEFVGYSTDPAALLASASLFLATATAEPYGLAVVEAMATGLPIVASDSGAHPETLADSALLFPAGDVAACAAHLARLAQSPEERKSLGARAVARQRQELSLSRHVDRLEALYDEVVGSW